MWRSDGVRFLVLRRRLRITQEELPRRSGVSRRIIGVIESGNWESVRFGKLARVAEALGAKLYPNLTWRGERLDRLVDAGHAELFARFSLRGRAARAWLREAKPGVSGLLMYVPLTDVRVVGVRDANRGPRVRSGASRLTVASVAAQEPTFRHASGPSVRHSVS